MRLRLLLAPLCWVTRHRWEVACSVVHIYPGGREPRVVLRILECGRCAWRIAVGA